MIRSMTGFARRERKGLWGNLVCEVRTVNHRYLEVSLRLPDELRSIEGDLRQSIANSLRRGKVDAGFYLKSGATAATSLELNGALLDEVLRKVTEVQQRVPGAAPISALDVLRWPGIVREAETDVAPLLQVAQELMGESLTELNQMRAREGSRIRDLIRQRCTGLQTQVAVVKARLPEISARMRARITERLASINTTLSNERLEQELVLYAHKMDVDEELDRLIGHIAEIENVIDANEPAGRRLDFLMQELNREANTLSSKSQDLETTRAAVELKVIIEQMREQVQNVE
jgi:uncharacterized protein (TIGR00255 family)